MLKAHFDAVEAYLLALSRLAANTGHPMHKGLAREAFVREFLSRHLGETVDVGTGEIIDGDSKPGDKRHNIDVVVYRRSCPRLPFGGGVTGFLAESVVAAIEVKSNLTKAEFSDAMKAAADIKRLKRTPVKGLVSGYHPPGVLAYLFAYDGPDSMETIHSWIPPEYSKLKLARPVWGKTQNERIKVAVPALDGVFVLGKGHLYSDNSPISAISQEFREQHPECDWVLVNSATGNLLCLFLIIASAISGFASQSFDLTSYIQRVGFSDVSVGGVSPIEPA